MNLHYIQEKYKEIIDKNNNDFETFLNKRSEGARDITSSAREKGGYSLLTATHFRAKTVPYQKSKQWANKPNKDELFKKEISKVYKKLENIDNLTQDEFQKLMGELEVWGEVYLQSTKPKKF